MPLYLKMLENINERMRHLRFQYILIFTNRQGQETFLALSADKPATMTQSAQTTIPPSQS